MASHAARRYETVKALAVLVLVVALTLPYAASAAEPDPAEFTPPGYEFCGWRDFTHGGWAMQWSEDLAGAYLVLFADGMTCLAARRNYSRLRHAKRPPYQPLRPGHRCRTLRSAHEFLDVRCVKKGGGRKFRYQTGA